ncbi:hypothetical protein GCM10027162_78280 [Streptomyces incanus]
MRPGGRGVPPGGTCGGSLKPREDADDAGTVGTAIGVGITVAPGTAVEPDVARPAPPRKPPSVRKVPPRYSCIAVPEESPLPTVVHTPLVTA